MTWVRCVFGNVLCLYLCFISKRNETNTTFHQHLINAAAHWSHFYGKHTISKGDKSDNNQAKGFALRYVVKIKYSCAIFQPHENNGCQEEKRRFQSVAPSNSPRLSIKKNKKKTTHPCSPRQALLSRSTSPRWLDPRQTSSTVVPRQLFLTGVQKRGCRLQRQRWCQQQGGGRRQRQWWQLGLRHKWWFKIFQLLEIAASLECLTSSFW